MTDEERIKELEKFIMDSACALYSGHGTKPEELRKMTPEEAMNTAIGDVNTYWGYA